MSDLKLYEEFVQSLLEEEKILVRNKKSGAVYDINQKSFNPSKHEVPKPKEIDKAEKEVEKKAEKKGSSHNLSKSSIDNARNQSNKIDGLLKDADDDTKERGRIVKEQFNKLLNAKSEEEEVEAIQVLIDNNLIQGHSGGTKIYMSPNTLLPRKFFAGEQGNSLTKRMNAVIAKHNLPIEIRQSSADRTLADTSGKHNEAGVVAYLYDSPENKKAYEELQKKFTDLGGGDEKRYDEINREVAEMIKNSLPPGSKITGAEQLGGNDEASMARKAALGLKPKSKVDYVVHYKDKDGKDQMMKVTAKTYSDPSKITMENSGAVKAGEKFLGKDLGEKVDKKYQELWAKYKWDDTMSDKEKRDRKTALKKEYLQEFEKAMQELAKTKEGQKQLTQMWRDVHGCDEDLYAQIINKKTGEKNLHPPGHYCNPGPPFKIKYDGTKMVVDVGGSEGDMEIVLKTEDTKSPKVLINHVKRKKKKDDK
jgi:hypothetical protein